MQGAVQVETVKKPAAITLNITHDQLERIDRIVKQREKTNPFIKRADVLRELLERGLAQEPR